MAKIYLVPESVAKELDKDKPNLGVLNAIEKAISKEESLKPGKHYTTQELLRINKQK